LNESAARAERDEIAARGDDELVDWHCSIDRDLRHGFEAGRRAALRRLRGERTQMSPMSKHRPTHTTSCVWALAGGLTLTACSGGSSSSDSDFALLSTNVADNVTWQINRPMWFTFNRPVDFSSVNLNSISIARVLGGSASGDFQMGTLAGTSTPDPNTVVFQPHCPTVSDYSDAGLLPGGVSYILAIRSGVDGIRSVSGSELGSIQSISFSTPDSDQPSVLFLDPTIGPPLPRIYDATSAQPITSNFCYVEIGGDPDPDHGVRFMHPDDPNLGAQTPAAFASPLNLYSDASSSVVVVLELNQPVNPASTNINSNTIRFEYLTGGDPSNPVHWSGMPHDVALAANCTTSGCRIRITPIGILPQGRTVRVVITPQLSDLVGQESELPIVVGSFVVGTAYDPGTTTPGIAVDEKFEPFLIAGNAPGSLEDTTTAIDVPRAQWGNGQLSAAFNFGGTGGLGGAFDWQIGVQGGTSPITVTLDTTFTLITDATQQHTEPVLGGVVDVRNLTIWPNGRLVVQGPNPCKILASGSVSIYGQLVLTGTNQIGVTAFNATNIPVPGAAGQAGGGKGGTANYLTTQSTPIGESGYGAFNTSGGGGGGGETGYGTDPNGDEDHRRGAGGGGGALGHDVTYSRVHFNGTAVSIPCADQSVVGLDVEPGFAGGPFASGALHPPGTVPAGGPRGALPFFDDDPTNDFWGSMLTQAGTLIQGELTHPWAGAGGGAGGNACDTSHFPTTPFSPTGDERGSGGGGGGGSLTIFCLGNITIGQLNGAGSGRIDASGGVGGQGEASGGALCVGGGGGGGSGGHVILQTASQIDFTTCTSTSTPAGGIYALGGEGGVGASPAFPADIPIGGASNGSPLPFASQDALPFASQPGVPNGLYYPNTSAPCGIAFPPSGTPSPPDYEAGLPVGMYAAQPSTSPNTVGNPSATNLGPEAPMLVAIGGGGDGGPGLIQLHVPSLAKIKAPSAAGQTFYKILKPPPVGTSLVTINSNPVLAWNQLLPVFGPKSQAWSKWIPLGAASVDPLSNTPKIVDFFFGGTDETTGHVNTVIPSGGTPAQAQVAELPTIFRAPLVIGTNPALPYLAPDGRTVVFDAATLSDDIYTRNPNIVKQFALELTPHGSSTPATFNVGSASYIPASETVAIPLFRVTVANSGAPLHVFGTGDSVDIRPRFFRISTQGVADSLPQSSGPGQAGSTVTIEFQATTQTPDGSPNEETPSAFEKDISRLSNVAVYPNASQFRYVRFRISFDLLSDPTAQLTPATPVTSLQFFRLPFKF
jgi:hypothetical protein